MNLKNVFSKDTGKEAIILIGIGVVLAISKTVSNDPQLFSPQAILIARFVVEVITALMG